MGLRALARRIAREGHIDAPKRVAWWRTREQREAIKAEQAKRLKPKMRTPVERRPR